MSTVQVRLTSTLQVDHDLFALDRVDDETPPMLAPPFSHADNREILSAEPPRVAASRSCARAWCYAGLEGLPVA